MIQVRLVGSSEEEHVWLLSLLRLRARAVLVQLDSANGAAVVLLDPVGQAVAAESVLAGKLDAVFSLLALLKADVAVTLLSSLFGWQILDVLVGAASSGPRALRSHVHSHAHSFSEELTEKVRTHTPSLMHMLEWLLLPKEVVKHTEGVLHLSFMSEELIVTLVEESSCTAHLLVLRLLSRAIHLGHALMSSKLLLLLLHGVLVHGMRVLTG